MTSFTKVALAALLSMGIAGAAGAADVIKERQQGFKGHADNIKAAKAAIEAGNPQDAVEPANGMAAWAAKIPTMFPEGTGKESGQETAALPTIWSDWAGFEKAAMANKAAAENLATVAGSGDAAAAGEALKALGGTCGACHKEYREKKS